MRITFNARIVAACALVVAGALMTGALVAGCGLGVTATTPASAATPPSAATATSSTTRAATPTFGATIEPIPVALRARMVRVGSWRPGCPVSIDRLRLIRLSYWGFDARPHQGYLVVAQGKAPAVVRVFRVLFDKRFPIRSMRLIEDFGADDHRSMAADNTSAFNGRYVSGTHRWSMHAYGIAIDIDPVENPYVSGSYVSPSQARPYADRSLRRPGMIHAGDTVVRAFAAIGWGWGGSWRPARDYQHFSANGR
jgi:hypothetical protein